MSAHHETSTATDNDALSAQLGRYIARMRPDELPTEVVEHAKLCLLDTLGCALYGATLRWSAILSTTLAGIDHGGSSAVWGTADRLSPAHAALANGAAVHAFELDDLHKESILHAGSVVTPAVFAAADVRGRASGPELLLALVVGYEIGARVGMTVGTPHLLQGWHPTGTHGALAAAAAASSMLALDPVGVQHALGIAGSQSAGLMAAQFSSMVKRFHAGRAAQSGLYSALLARNGYLGITNIFESDYGGYCSTFSPSYDLAALTADLGERWEALRYGFKPYSANGSCHPAIELLQDMLASDEFTADDVEQVEVHASSATVAHVGWPYRPDSVTTAQMNLPYIAAVVLTDGEAFVDQFSERRIHDPRLVQLSQRVHVSSDPEIDARGPSHRHETRVSLHLRDGRVLRGEKRTAKGSTADPLTGADVRAKYRRLAGEVLPARGVERLEEMIDGLMELPDTAELVSTLAPRGPDEGASRH